MEALEASRRNFWEASLEFLDLGIAKKYEEI
jgi:hypothetical protein